MGTLALLPGPRGWGRGGLQSARQQVVDCSWRSCAGEAKLGLELFESGWVLGRSQVEIAAKEQRCVGSPLDHRRGRAEHVLGGEPRPVVGRVQVGDADLRAPCGRDAGKRHRPSLRAAAVDRQLAPLDDLAK